MANLNEHVFEGLERNGLDLCDLDLRVINFDHLNFDEEIGRVEIPDLGEEEEEKEVVNQEQPARMQKVYTRDMENPFEMYTEKTFKVRFWFSKDAVLNGILPRVEVCLEKPNNSGLPITPVIQLLVCLRYYATASFQLVSGDLMKISQPTVSRIVFRLSLLIARLMPEFIKFPETDARKMSNRQLFEDMGKGRGNTGLPGIDAAIGCTHVRLTETRLNQIQEVYRNRKGYFSLNAQAVVGPRMEFLKDLYAVRGWKL